MTDLSKAGTAEEFVRIDLGPIGELFVADDGDDDHYLTTGIDTPEGHRKGFGSGLMDYRDEHGDAALEAALKDAADAHEAATGGGGPTDYGVGIFVCDDCSRSFPRRKNQTPDASTDTCPDCAGGDTAP